MRLELCYDLEGLSPSTVVGDDSFTLSGQELLGSDRARVLYYDGGIDRWCERGTRRPIERLRFRSPKDTGVKLTLHAAGEMSFEYAHPGQFALECHRGSLVELRLADGPSWDGEPRWIARLEPDDLWAVSHGRLPLQPSQARGELILTAGSYPPSMPLWDGVIGMLTRPSALAERSASSVSAAPLRHGSR